MEEMSGIVFRISIVYVYALALLRLSGKRSISNLSALDFVVAAIIGDVFDNMFWAEIPLTQGLVGLTTIILLHILTALASSRSIRFHHLVASTKTAVIHLGNFVEEGLRGERTPEETVLFELRLQGEEELQEIEEACWEPNGQLSIRKLEQAKPAEKKDLPLLEEALR